MKNCSFPLAAALCVLISAIGATAHADASKPDAATQLQLQGIEARSVDTLWGAASEHYWHAGDYNRIIALLRICVESDPNFEEAYSDGAWLLWSMDEKPAANAFLDDGVKRSKYKWIAHYDFGENLMVRREFKDALPHLQQATKDPQAPVLAWKMLAHAYEKTGDLKNSLETWKYVVKHFPDDVAAPVNLKRVQAKLGG